MDRLGLHYTSEELVLWKQQAKDGPYKKSGDAHANSPGDWDRITANAKTFLGNPGADRYGKSVWKGSGCVPNLNQSGYNISQDPATQGDKLRDAAFYYLITGETSYANAVRSELLVEANDPNLDFTKTGRWCPGGQGDLNPGFIIAEWLVRMLYAYDYIKATLSDADKAKLNAWFLGGARYMFSNYDPNMRTLFVDSPNGNYTLTPATLAKEKGAGSSMYFGGPKARFVSRQHNNRRASLACYVGLAGIFFNDAGLISSAKRFFKETIMFSVFPSGYYSDFLRGTAASPEKGYTYSTLGTLYVFADALARNGDTELYTWTTTGGTLAATSGADASSDGKTAKGLKMNIKAMLDLRNHVKSIYVTNDTAEKYRIDGRTPGGSHSVWDIMYSVPNLFFKDKYITDSYTRKATGAVPYPTNAQTSGARPAWSLGDYPGILFMFGQKEGKVWPFPGGIVKKVNTITFAALPDKKAGDPPFTLSATATSGESVVFLSSDKTIAIITGNVVTIVGKGTVLITATEDGNATYLPATPVVRVLIVNSQDTTMKTVSFTLINSDTGVDIGTMMPGGVINLALLSTRNLNIRANTDPATVGSVVFELSGKQVRTVTESGPPLALWGDNGGKYNAWTPELGSYQLKGTPFTLAAGGGTQGEPLLISFSVIDGIVPPSEWKDLMVEKLEFSTKTGAVRVKGIMV